MFQYRHPHPAVTTNVVIFTIISDRLQLLLVRRRREPHAGQWALPGGFVDINDDLDKSASDTLERETGVQGVYLEQLYTFGEPGRDPRERVIAVAYYALVPIQRVKTRAGDADIGWFPVEGKPPLAFDHDRIVDLARRRLGAKLDYSTIGFQFMPEEFTLSELQRVYEVVGRTEIDKRNFRKWVLGLNHLEVSGERRSGSHRPATLYRVKRPGSVEFIR